MLIKIHALWMSTLSRRAVVAHMNLVLVKWSSVHVGIGMDMIFSKIRVAFSNTAALRCPAAVAATAPVEAGLCTAATGV